MEASVSERMEPELTANDVRNLCGDLLDWKVAAILALRPSPDEVATATAWATGQDELGQAGRPLEGLAARVYDVLKADDYPDER